MLGVGQTARAQADADADEGRRSVDVGVYVSPPFVSEQSEKYGAMAIDPWEIVAGKLGLATRYVAFSNLKDLPGKTTGVFTGSAAEDHLHEIGIGKHAYPGLGEAVAALEAGRIEGIEADAPILEHYVHVHPKQGMEVVGSLFHPDKYGFAFPLESDLTTPVTIQILNLQEGGSIEDLRLENFGNAF